MLVLSCRSPKSDTMLHGTRGHEGELQLDTNGVCIYNVTYLLHAQDYLTHPYASPLFGDFTGLPPMLIQA